MAAAPAFCSLSISSATSVRGQGHWPRRFRLSSSMSIMGAGNGNSDSPQLWTRGVSRLTRTKTVMGRSSESPLGSRANVA
ncbi:MAG: hypothetical protein R6V76_02900, partial [Desulfobacterales bacterium]